MAKKKVSRKPSYRPSQRSVPTAKGFMGAMGGTAGAAGAVGFSKQKDASSDSKKKDKGRKPQSVAGPKEIGPAKPAAKGGKKIVYGKVVGSTTAKSGSPGTKGLPGKTFEGQAVELPPRMKGRPKSEIEKARSIKDYPAYFSLEKSKPEPKKLNPIKDGPEMPPKIKGKTKAPAPKGMKAPKVSAKGGVKALLASGAIAGGWYGYKKMKEMGYSVDSMVKGGKKLYERVKAEYDKRAAAGKKKPSQKSPGAKKPAPKAPGKRPVPKKAPSKGPKVKIFGGKTPGKKPPSRLEIERKKTDDMVKEFIEKSRIKREKMVGRKLKKAS